jgi:hypothetical protein
MQATKLQPVPDDDREFSDEELEAALVRAGEMVRETAFAANQPIVFVQNGELTLRHPDGTTEIVPSGPTAEDDSCP